MAVPCFVSGGFKPAAKTVSVRFSRACLVNYSKKYPTVRAFGLGDPDGEPVMWGSSDVMFQTIDPSFRYDRSPWVHVANG